MAEAHSRQLPGLVDALIADHHDVLLDLLELRINEAARPRQCLRLARRRPMLSGGLLDARQLVGAGATP